MEKKQIDIVLLILLLFLFLSPSRFFNGGIYSITVKVISYNNGIFTVGDNIIILITGYLLLKNHFKAIYFNDFKYYFIILLLVYVYSVFFFGTTIYYFDGFSELFHYLLSFILSFFLIQRKEYRQTTFYAIIIAFVLLIIVSPLSMLYFRSYSNMHRAGTLGLGANDLGSIGSILIIFVIFSWEKKIISKKYLLILFLLGLLGIGLAASRRTVFIIALFLIVKVVPKNLKKSIFILTTLSVVLLLASNFLLKFISEHLDVPFFYRINWYLKVHEVFFSDQGRFLYFETFIKNIPNHLLGYGSLLDTASGLYHFETIHTHDIFLQYFAQYGVLVGSILGVALIIAILPPFFGDLELENEQQMIDLTKSYLFTMFISGFFSHPYVYPKEILFLSIFLFMGKFYLIFVKTKTNETSMT